MEHTDVIFDRSDAFCAEINEPLQFGDSGSAILCQKQKLRTLKPCGVLVGDNWKKGQFFHIVGINLYEHRHWLMEVEKQWPIVWEQDDKVNNVLDVCMCPPPPPGTC